MEANSSMPPVTLLNHASHVQKQAIRYKNLHELADKHRSFKKQLEEFTHFSEQLESVNIIRRELVAEGIQLQTLIPTGALQENFKSFIEDVQKNRSILIDPSHASRRKELRKRLKLLMEDRISKTEDDWQKHVLNLIPPPHSQRHIRRPYSCHRLSQHRSCHTSRYK